MGRIAAAAEGGWGAYARRCGAARGRGEALFALGEEAYEQEQPSPTCDDELCFAAPAAWRELVPGEELLSSAERYDLHVDLYFKELDKNGDGKLSVEELAEAMRAVVWAT